MKKLMLFVALIFALTSCKGVDKNEKPKDVNNGKQTVKDDTGKQKYIIKGLVAQKKTNGILVCGTVGNNELYIIENSDYKIFIDGKEAKYEDIKSGMEIDIEYNGAIMESYPARFAGIVRLDLKSLDKSKKNDKIGIYDKIIYDIVKEFKGHLEIDTKLNVLFTNMDVEEYVINAINYINESLELKLIGDEFTERPPQDLSLRKEAYLEFSGKGETFDIELYKNKDGKKHLYKKYNGCKINWKDGVWTDYKCDSGEIR